MSFLWHVVDLNEEKEWAPPDTTKTMAYIRHHLKILSVMGSIQESLVAIVVLGRCIVQGANGLQLNEIPERLKHSGVKMVKSLPVYRIYMVAYFRTTLEIPGLLHIFLIRGTIVVRPERRQKCTIGVFMLQPTTSCFTIIGTTYSPLSR